MKPMREISQHYREAYARCREAMGEKRPFLIGIDGWHSSGKSTMARFLAWQLGAPCIETDFFLKTWGIYDWAPMETLVRQRLDNRRRVIVEGVGLLHTCRTLGVEPDFLIYMRNEGRDVLDSRAFLDWIETYNGEFHPESHADFVARWGKPESDPLAASLLHPPRLM